MGTPAAASHFPRFTVATRERNRRNRASPLERSYSTCLPPNHDAIRSAQNCWERADAFPGWAPKAKRVDVVLEKSADEDPYRASISLEAEPGGYFTESAAADAGAFYRFRVDGAETFRPDPASRSQPQGPHRSSCVLDPKRFSGAMVTGPAFVGPAR